MIDNVMYYYLFLYMIYYIMHDANMCIKPFFFSFKFLNSYKIQLMQWWWINSYSNNINKPQSMITSMIRLIII
jgi:hypothetical protein